MRAPSLIALLLVSLLSACASLPGPGAPPPGLLGAASFAAPSGPVGTDQVFALSAEMKRYLAVDIAARLRDKGPQAGLIEALYEKGELRLEYDATRTKTAAEAFASRSGNCLSLVIMTSAFARELGLPVEYESADLDPTWCRSGDILFASAHINITIGPRLLDSWDKIGVGPMTIDFLPPEDLAGLRTHEVEERTVLAMYANNRAAEALAKGRIDDAYAWVGEALRHDARYLVAYNTLGVVYLRHGDTAAAGHVFDYVLTREPRNTFAMANLAEAYERLGRAAEAARLRVRLAALESDPPFHFFNLGLAAMRRADYAAARDYFSREVKRAGYNHEFHFWLGLAEWRLGEVAQAQKQLELAMDNSVTRDQHALYAAKLEWLQAHRRQ